jgi:hypothetical protein
MACILKGPQFAHGNAVAQVNLSPGGVNPQLDPQGTIGLQQALGQILLYIVESGWSGKTSLTPRYIHSRDVGIGLVAVELAEDKAAIAEFELGV